jgi:hypothetical protein
MIPFELLGPRSTGFTNVPHGNSSSWIHTVLFRLVELLLHTLYINALLCLNNCYNLLLDKMLCNGTASNSAQLRRLRQDASRA